MTASLAYGKFRTFRWTWLLSRLKQPFKKRIREISSQIKSKITRAVLEFCGSWVSWFVEHIVIVTGWLLSVYGLFMTGSNQNHEDQSGTTTHRGCSTNRKNEMQLMLDQKKKNVLCQSSPGFKNGCGMHSPPLFFCLLILFFLFFFCKFIFFQDCKFNQCLATILMLLIIYPICHGVSTKSSPYFPLRPTPCESTWKHVLLCLLSLQS